MRRILNFILIVAGLITPTLSGQSLLDEVNFQSGQFGGVHLIGVSVFAGYATSAYPQASLSSLSLPNLGGDGNYGATASLGWQHHGENINIGVMYTGTYGGMFRYSDLNAYSQSASLSVSRTFAQKWSVSLSGSGSDSSIEQYLFQPTSLGVISQIPTTFDNLAAAFGAGQFTNTQAASMLTGAPIPQTAARTLLLGDRVLSYSATAGLVYTASPRLQFHFSSFAAAGQARSGGQNGTTPSTYVMPRSIGVSGGVGYTYAVSPRTQITADVEASRSLNQFQSFLGTSASVSVGRKMGMHWFMSAQGGISYGVMLHQVSGTPRTQQMIVGGSFGYQASIYTLVGTYQQAGSDPFGFAIGTVSSMSGAWTLHQPGTRWSVFTSYAQQQTRNTGYASLSGWQGSGGISMALSPQTSLTAQYAYMSSSGTYLGTYNSVAVQSVRLSLGWAPQSIAR